jgi:hypothetical protein
MRLNEHNASIDNQEESKEEDNEESKEESKEDAEEESDPSNHPNMINARRHYENLANPKQFPKAANDFSYPTVDGFTHEIKIIDLFEKACPFPCFPKMHVKADVDSVYLHDKDLTNIAKSFQKTEVLTMQLN